MSLTECDMLSLKDVKLTSPVIQVTHPSASQWNFFFKLIEFLCMQTDKAQFSPSTAGRPQSVFEQCFLSRPRRHCKKRAFGKEGVERWELNGGQRAQWVSQPVHYQACLSDLRPSPPPDSAFSHFARFIWAGSRHRNRQPYLFKVWLLILKVRIRSLLYTPTWSAM